MGGKRKRVPYDDVKPIKCQVRYYTRNEYNRLSSGKKKFLRQLRQANEELGIDVTSKNSDDSRSISVLASAVDKLEVEKEKEKSDDAKSTKVLTNTNNSALTRIETRQKKGTAD